MKYLLFLIILFIGYPTNTIADNSHVRAGVRPVQKEEALSQKHLFESMLSGTAKVLFVDSMVVDKNNFFSKIPLSSDAGTLEFIDKRFTYTNELKNHRIYADGDSIHGFHLFSTDYLGDSWSQPKQLKELDEEVKDAQFPFLLSDGVTLFFSAKGDKSIGGYDIFMTLFNEESRTYYKPENYGLPFNSTANDYLLAIDDVHSLGWLVSDRYQPKGKVCIYTFVPTMPRQNFTAENITDKQLEAYAKLTSIQETWKFGNREAALQRLKLLTNERQRTTEKQEFYFTINDRTVYQSINDFRSEKTKKLYQQLLELKKQLSANEETLSQLRSQYQLSNMSGKLQMCPNLLKAEKAIQSQRIEIMNFAKQLRNEENRLLTQ
ncbi:hypothetical protein [Hoylesella timonensis]|uniref:WD40-like protein n=1 Tax=Hoylesella timonensis S9-PR14 TaxID=1401062 RepID=A0A098YQ13_9BACT|nr:hypothetical protein [Hoylesella timonensis]KGI21362.1 hypothetical protein HMPREF9304_10795 [Hoylesella timonensis S9-PR14]